MVSAHPLLVYAVLLQRGLDYTYGRNFFISNSLLWVLFGIVLEVVEKTGIESVQIRISFETP